MSISINSVYKFIEKKFLKGLFDNLIKSSKKEYILNKKKHIKKYKKIFKKDAYFFSN